MNRTTRSLLFGLSLAVLGPVADAQQLGVGAAQPALSFVVPVVTNTTSGTTTTPSVSNCCGGIMTTLAGNGTVGSTGDGGPASAAELTTGLRGIAADAAGDVYFVDDTNHTVRVVYQGGATAAALIVAENPTVTAPVVGDIYLIAGKEGTSGIPTNGTLASSALITPGAGLSLDAAGDIYFNDTATNKVWIIYAGGTNTTGTNFIAIEAGVTAPVLGHLYAIAGGSSTSGYTGDGTLATAGGVEFKGVNDMKFDSSGNMYIVDQGNNAIREVSGTTGIITTIAGGASGAGTAGATGLNGPATAALLNTPYGIAVDPSGNVFIADKSNHAIKVLYVGDTKGTSVAKLITLENPSITNPTPLDLYQVAGVTSGSPSKNSPYGYIATSSYLNAPTMVALDNANNIYIADNGNYIVQEVNATTGILVTIAGNGTEAYAGDGGLAISAELGGIRCVAVDASGRIYITDATNSRIRQVSQGLMSFVGQAAGTTSPPELIQLVNTGNATLTFTGTPTFAGTNANDFAVDTAFTLPSSDPYSPSTATVCTSSSSVAPGASCFLAFTYSPTNSGTSAATVSIPTNDALSPQIVTLLGQLTPAPTALAASATTAYPGEIVTLTAVVQSPGGTPTGSVSFFQGTTLLQTVTLPSSGTVTMTLPSLNVGSYSYTAVYSGDSNFAGSTSAALAISVDTFSISASTNTVSVTPGQATPLTLTITGAGPLAQTLSLSCTAPSILGCSFNPSSATVAVSGTTTVTVNIAAVATTTGAIKTGPKAYTLAFVPVGTLLILSLGLRRRRSMATFLASLLCLAAFSALTGCGKSNIGTPLPASTQTVTVNVSATGGATTFTQSVNVTVNVQ